jgi:hypothetical protein
MYDVARDCILGNMETICIISVKSRNHRICQWRLNINSMNMTVCGLVFSQMNVYISQVLHHTYEKELQDDIFYHCLVAKSSALSQAR